MSKVIGIDLGTTNSWQYLKAESLQLLQTLKV